jgi:hypothetical protein
MSELNYDDEGAELKRFIGLNRTLLEGALGVC